jgi:hypothetical protein
VLLARLRTALKPHRRAKSPAPVFALAERSTYATSNGPRLTATIVLANHQPPHEIGRVTLGEGYLGDFEWTSMQARRMFLHAARTQYPHSAHPEDLLVSALARP